MKTMYFGNRNPAPIDRGVGFLLILKIMIVNIVVIATIIGLTLFLILHKPHGVKQKTTVYGQIYYTRTVLYLNGIKLQEWTDASYTEGQVKQAKKEMYNKAKLLFDSIEKKSNEI